MPARKQLRRTFRAFPFVLLLTLFAFLGVALWLSLALREPATTWKAARAQLERLDEDERAREAREGYSVPVPEAYLASRDAIFVTTQAAEASRDRAFWLALLSVVVLSLLTQAAACDAIVRAGRGERFGLLGSLAAAMRRAPAVLTAIGLVGLLAWLLLFLLLPKREPWVLGIAWHVALALGSPVGLAIPVAVVEGGSMWAIARRSVRLLRVRWVVLCGLFVVQILLFLAGTMFAFLMFFGHHMGGRFWLFEVETGWSVIAVLTLNGAVHAFAMPAAYSLLTCSTEPRGRESQS